MKNVKIQKRKVLNELIQEIVDQQVEIMLLEYASGSEGALYGVFVKPFIDTANVIRSEVEKTGASLIGKTASGLLGAIGTLLPMFDKIPFTEKTWDQAMEGIKQYTNAAIKGIDGKYADSYKAIAGSFKNPDIAFAAFAFNPGLYLGSALAANTIGVTLSTASSMLGTSGNFSRAYSNLLSQIGIFTPGFTPQGGGVSVDMGMGGDSGMYENNSYKKLKNAISFLVEFQLYQEEAKINDPVYKAASEKYKELIKQIQKNGFLLDKTVSNNVWKNVYSKTKNNEAIVIDKWISELKDLNPEKIIGNKEQFINTINASPKTGNIIDKSIDSFVKKLTELVSKSQSLDGYPPTIEKFFEEVDKSKNEEIKNKAIEFLNQKQIKLTGTFKETYDSLEEKEKNELKEEYPKIRNIAETKKKEIPSNIEKVVESEFSKLEINGIPIVNQKTKDEIINRIKASLTSGQ